MKKDLEIKIYSTPTCSYCIMAKQFLKENNISFKDIDVSKDRDSVDEMVELSGQMGVPVIIINGQIVVGFDKEKIEELIK